MTQNFAAPLKDKTEILQSLEPLFQQAEAEKKWFYCAYQDMWISPKDLRQSHSQGRLIWGPVNWALRDPSELLELHRKRTLDAQQELANLKARIAQG